MVKGKGLARPRRATGSDNAGSMAVDGIDDSEQAPATHTGVDGDRGGFRGNGRGDVSGGSSGGGAASAAGGGGVYNASGMDAAVPFAAASALPNVHVGSKWKPQLAFNTGGHSARSGSGGGAAGPAVRPQQMGAPKEMVVTMPETTVLRLCPLLDFDDVQEGDTITLSFWDDDGVSLQEVPRPCSHSARVRCP